MPDDRFTRVLAIFSRPLGSFTSGQWLLLIAAPLLLFTFNLDGARSLTVHEMYMAGAAKQMTLDDDWILLRLGDQFFLEKPPLTHWAAAASASLLGGFTAGTVRLPLALAGVGVVLLVAWMMAHLFGRRIGLLAGLVQASAVYMVTHARLAQADMLLLLIVMAAIAAFLKLDSLDEDASARTRFFWRLLFWGLIGLTNLCKGLLFGAVLVLLTCIGGIVIRRDIGALKKLFSPSGLLLAVVVALWWPVVVVLREPAVLELWNSHLFGRAAGTLGYQRPLWYYLTTWPVQLLPWTPLLFFGVGASLRRAWSEPKSPDRFVWWWALAQMFLLTLSSGKHHHYLIYALPAMSPIIGMGLLRIGERIAGEVQQARRSSWFWFSGAAVLVIGGAAAAVLVEAFRIDILCVASLLALGGLGIGIFVRRRRPAFALAVGYAVMVAAQLYVQGSIMPRRDRSRADGQFLAKVQRDLAPTQRLFASGGPEIARHIFYLSRPVEGVWKPEDIQGRLADDEVFYVITRMKNREKLLRYGQVTQVHQSTHTRSEASPEDRYTLYRVDRTVKSAATDAHRPRPR